MGTTNAFQERWTDKDHAVNRKRPVRLPLALLVSMLLAGCGSSGGDGTMPDPEPTSAFSYLGLSGRAIVDIRAGFGTSEATLVAGTDKGIYVYEGGTDWSLRTPENWDVLALEALYDTHLIASVQISAGTRYFAESLNGGWDWGLVTTDFGDTDDPLSSEPLHSLEFVDSTGVLFGTGNGVLAHSEDFGRHWSVLEGEYGVIGTGLSALSIVGARGDAWYGGQGALENPVLHRYSVTTGLSEDHSEAVEDHLGRPSTVEAIRFYPSSPDQVYVMGEGGIMGSSDYGMNWEPLLVNDTSRFYFDLVIDDHTGVAYTAGWDKNFADPQPLILETSTDSGRTWTKTIHPDQSIRGGVWSVALIELAGERRLFLGLQGGGVYEVNRSALEP